jgi:glycosyltransferase involved in cell wall biosynthesis
VLATRPAVEYVVFHGSPPPGSGFTAAPQPYAFPNVHVANRWATVGGRRVVWQPVLRRIAGGGFAGAVLGVELKFLANVGLVPLLKARGKAVVLWGQGGEKAEDRGALGDALSARAKRAWTRAADAYLVYTAGGAARLQAAGLPADRIHVVNNTLDMDGQIALHARAQRLDPAAVRYELGLRTDSVVLLYLGRVYREKRLEELLELVAALRARAGLPPVEAVVAGDGPALEQARAAHPTDGVHFLGDVRDQERLARVLRIASALVIPGKVGLAVNHAIAHGLPTITRESDLHAPEVEYIEHGRNGLVVPGSFDDFVAAVADTVAHPDTLDALAQGARSSRARLSLAAMVDAFDTGVRSGLARRG